MGERSLWTHLLTGSNIESRVLVDVSVREFKRLALQVAQFAALDLAVANVLLEHLLRCGLNGSRRRANNAREHDYVCLLSVNFKMRHAQRERTLRLSFCSAVSVGLDTGLSIRSRGALRRGRNWQN